MHKKRIRQKIGKREKAQQIARLKATMPVMVSMACAQAHAHISRIAAMPEISFPVLPVVSKALAIAQATQAGLKAQAEAARVVSKWIAFAESQSADYHYRKKFNFPTVTTTKG